MTSDQRPNFMQFWQGNPRPGKLTAEPDISMSGAEHNTVQVSSFGCESFTTNTASTMTQNQSSSPVDESPSDDDGRSVRSDTGTIIYRETSPHPSSTSGASQTDEEPASLSDDAPIPAGDTDVDGNTAAALTLPKGDLSGLWLDSRQVFDLNPVPPPRKLPDFHSGTCYRSQIFISYCWKGRCPWGESCSPFSVAMYLNPDRFQAGQAVERASQMGIPRSQSMCINWYQAETVEDLRENILEEWISRLAITATQYKTKIDDAFKDGLAKAIRAHWEIVELVLTGTDTKMLY
jgi:hypothetical protein